MALQADAVVECGSWVECAGPGEDGLKALTVKHQAEKEHAVGVRETDTHE